jgi:hypothetical protein
MPAFDFNKEEFQKEKKIAEEKRQAKKHARLTSIPFHADGRGNSGIYSGTANILGYTKKLVMVRGPSINAASKFLSNSLTPELESLSNSLVSEEEFLSNSLTPEEDLRFKLYSGIIVDCPKDIMTLYPEYVLFLPGWKNLEHWRTIWDIMYQRMKAFRLPE